MKIELRFRSGNARSVIYFLKRRYSSKSNDLAKLAMVAVRREVANEAQKELDELKTE